MKIAALSLALFCFLPAACTPLPGGVTLGEGETRAGPISVGEPFPLWQPCSRQQAREWAAQAGGRSDSGLTAASCYATLARQKGNPSQLADARKGLELAAAAAKRHPRNGLAHYLYAVLAGLQAEREPLKGLSMVPIIEREARLAAGLAPQLDQGGPDRVLGELYLQAPGFPVSVGDPARALNHYRKAVEIAPVVENRLGLAAALLATEDTALACRELRGVLKDLPSDSRERDHWRRLLELFGRLCDSIGGA